MKRFTRRNFLQLSTAAAAGTILSQKKAIAGPSGRRDCANGEVGIYTVLDTGNVDATFKQIADLGFNNCEIYTGGYDISLAGPLNKAIEKYNIKVHALFTLGPGPTTWNFYEGQQNIGLVSREYREARIDAMYQLSDLAKACRIPMVETHVGYIPENPNDPNYGETVEALKKVVGYCKKNGQEFLYHAGQESPTTVVRTIQDVGYDNQGIGMDTANLILYDRGHPTHSLKVYGKYIKLVNFKDGLYPTDTVNIGREVQIGYGDVNFPEFISELKAIGYTGPVVIEREDAKGEKWEKDVLTSKDFLTILLNS